MNWNMAETNDEERSPTAGIEEGRQSERKGDRVSQWKGGRVS